MGVIMWWQLFENNQNMLTRRQYFHAKLSFGSPNIIKIFFLIDDDYIFIYLEV